VNATTWDRTVLEKLSLEHLAEAWKDADDQITSLVQFKRDCEDIIDGKMDTERMEVFSYDGIDVERKPIVTWYEDQLVQLREYLSPEEYEALLTEQKPPPPRTHHKAKVKRLIKRGGTIRTIVEGAMAEQPARAKVKRVER
jgi:hypothetical protein